MTSRKVTFEKPGVSGVREYVVELGEDEEGPPMPIALRQPTALVAFEFSGALRMALAKHKTGRCRNLCRPTPNRTIGATLPGRREGHNPHQVLGRGVLRRAAVPSAAERRQGVPI